MYLIIGKPQDLQENNQNIQTKTSKQLWPIEKKSRKSQTQSLLDFARHDLMYIIILHIIIYIIIYRLYRYIYIYDSEPPRPRKCCSIPLGAQKISIGPVAVRSASTFWTVSTVGKAPAGTKVFQPGPETAGGFSHGKNKDGMW